QLGAALAWRSVPAGVSAWGQSAGGTPLLALASLAHIQQEAGAAQGRALALFAQALARDLDPDLLVSDADLDPLHAERGFGALLRRLDLGRRYAAVWHQSTTHTSAQSHGLSPQAHRKRWRELMAQGYRPAALGVTATPSGALVTASVWHRPVVAEEQRIGLARRQGRAAAALVRLGDAGS